ncbi:hypothetical protein J2Y49_001490 [Azospirillum sp. BE72]|nr:hypothetical protein [Azospirillum sp. BE72]
MTWRFAADVGACTGTVFVGPACLQRRLAASAVAGLVTARLDALEAAYRPRVAAALGIDET